MFYNVLARQDSLCCNRALLSFQASTCTLCAIEGCRINGRSKDELSL